LVINKIGYGLRNLLKKITHPFLKFGLNWYYSKPRSYTYEDCFVTVHPDVFPPQLTFSTKILLDFIKNLNLQNKTFLELGCGSGIISIYAAKKGAFVTATDINKTALQFLEKASIKNNVQLTIIESDLFDNLHKTSFDYIFINPPYYPKKPNSIKEKAWFCGENFEYFEQLFVQLPQYISLKNEVYMILSEDCEIQKIKAIALKNEINFVRVKEYKIVGEKKFLFKLH
jgi:release factor glutamine methyltransferase